jgi:hypothetical protein
MPTYPNTQAVRAAITNEIDRLQGDLMAAAASAPAPAEGRRRIPTSAPTKGAAPGASPAARDIVGAIDARIERLAQVRDWIDEDDELAGLIDSVIARRIRDSERRQARFNVALNAVFLLAGWLLSLVGTPTALTTLIGRG